MTLPGHLAIAYLEEDNPQKFYFRICPLLVREQDRIELFQDVVDQYPTDGFIRVVPDKNEMSQFKTRMRQMGRYCLLDLRQHPNDNDKIRPNKNSVTGSDPNAYIVYSDVICSLTPGLLTHVLDCCPPDAASEFTAVTAEPETACVALRAAGKISGPWKWEAAPDGAYTFRRAPASQWAWIADDQPAGICLSFSLPGGSTHSVYVNHSVLDKPDEVEPAQPVVAPVPVAPVAPAPVVEPAQTQRAAEPAALPDKPAQRAEPFENVLPIVPMTPHRAINSRISMREQTLFAQMGISPRRGRGLYEIIEEKWRRSRIDQLGHPVPGEATGSPANDPIENAMTAIRAVLPLPEARASLVEEMLRNETLNDALSEVYGARSIAAHGDDKCLTEMEAERLKLSMEIDALKRRREAERQRIVEEIRTEYEMDFAKLDKKKAELQTDIASLQQTEKDARFAAQTATESLDKLLKEDIDQKLVESAMTGRAGSLLRGIHGELKPTVAKPITVSPNACELISDVRAYFERAGRPISNDIAVNLLACLTIGRTLLISGPVGSGKRDTVRLLANAIGIATPEYKRFSITSNAKTATTLLNDGSLVCDDDAITMCLLASANVRNDLHTTVSAIYSAQMRRSSGLRAIVSIDDAPDAYPVPASLYDRSFLIRLSHAGADQPWRPAEARPVSYGKVVSLAAMVKAFAPVNDLPVEMELRMTALRERLDALGTPITRRSLDALWRYCSAVLPYMQCSPLELLDLALAQRGLPTLLSSMPLEALMELPEIFKGMPKCLKLLDQPLPLPSLY